MSWSGSLGVYVWSRPEAIINQHIFKVIPEHLPSWLVYNRLQDVIDSFRAIAADKATTMGHIQRGHLDSTKTLIPSEEDLARLNPLCQPLWNLFNLLSQQVLRLESLRDTLFPELMSGRIRVPEAKQAVDELIEPQEEVGDALT